MKLNHIPIDNSSAKPKYEQIADYILACIRKGQLGKGDTLPSINSFYKKIGVSRDTLIGAYKTLQDKGIVGSRPGKGFFIARSHILWEQRVLLFFDQMNGYKEILYQSLVKSLGRKYHTEIYFHYYNTKVLERFINDQLEAYDYFIIMPYFSSDISGIVKKIPSEKLIFLDNDIPAMKDISAVFQDFSADMYHALQTGNELLKKYNHLYIIGNKNFQFVPEGIITGFNKFCHQNQINGETITDITENLVKKSTAFVIFTDHDLYTLMRFAEKKGLIPGQDVGIISYDDTPLKELLAGGITVASTDFNKMGVTASEIIKGKIKGKFANPFSLIIRKSL